MTKLSDFEARTITGQGVGVAGVGLAGGTAIAELPVVGHDGAIGISRAS